MTRYAVIRSGVVENVVDLAPGAKWAPPEGTSLVAHDRAGPGWLYDGSAFAAPVVPEAEAPRRPKVVTDVEALITRIGALENMLIRRGALAESDVAEIKGAPK